MKIIISAINPLFPQKVIGGSTKHLHNVAVRLGEMGHTVEIISTQREDTKRPFQWYPNVTVRPLLQFKQPFPEPYAIPAHKMASNIRTLGGYLADADRYYMHDGEFLFPSIYKNIPTVISLRDNVYPETMLGGFLFQADKLILIADYSRQVVLASMGQIMPDLAERAISIPNGIDFDLFKPKTPNPKIFEIIPIDPTAQPIVLHPHRPEPSKGLLETVATVDSLVHQHGLTTLKTLVPRWFDADNSPEIRDFTDKVLREINARGLTNNFLFHDWIPQPLMPDYYNLGDVLLALGHFVEAFGNTVYEAPASGTPSVVARVATYRSLVPDELMSKVHFGDAKTAAFHAAAIIKNKQRTSPELMTYLKTHYDVDAQLTAYADAILNAKLRSSIKHRTTPITSQTRFVLPPWCYCWNDTMYYHDFLAKHRDLPQLTAVLQAHPSGFTFAEAEKVGVAEQTAVSWYRGGFIVPLFLHGLRF